VSPDSPLRGGLHYGGPMTSNSISLDDPYVLHATRNARSVQTLIGWIFWDPGPSLATNGWASPDRSATLPRALGLSPGPDRRPRPLPLAPFHRWPLTPSLNSLKARTVSRRTGPPVTRPFSKGSRLSCRAATKRWVGGRHASGRALTRCRASGRPFFAAHLALDRHVEVPALSGWLAVNALREWRRRYPLGPGRLSRAERTRSEHPAQRVAPLRR
jgi:hypothetical protein